MFLIDFPFKGCQGRSNRSSIVHAVSYFAFDFHLSKLFENFCLHAVSMTTHAPCMRCQCHLTHFEKFEYLREFEFIFEKALAP
jgi:hypothetical protein